MEIVVPVELVKKGEKVGTSEATLLAKLDKKPFSYALVVLFVYQNGTVFSPKALHLTDQDLADKFSGGVSMIVSVSLAISYPTLAVAPHMFVNAYNNVLAVAMETAYSFPQAQKVKECLKVVIDSILSFNNIYIYILSCLLITYIYIYIFSSC